jgi:succinate-semialdehyde dehydrogenase/glutarate-semialdehyde dehydrogenase
LIDEHLLEHGKTASETEDEIATSVKLLRSTAEYARRSEGRILPVADRAKRVLVSRAPLGVVAVITPWNAPILVPLEYLAPALAMGNAVVWKPAETVPRSSYHLAAAFEGAGWPDAALQMLGGGPPTGSALVRHPSLDAVCFTGSTEVGLDIAAVGGMRRLLLELGGNGPTIVFADADLQLAAQRVVEGARFFSGQSCAATERVLVDRAVAPELTEAVVAFARREQVGDPRDPDTTFGPLHLTALTGKVSRHVADAEQKGARVTIGGSPLRDAPTGNYWPLTVIEDVTAEMEVFAEETFGPVVPITAFDSESDALALARLGGYGLSASVFTRDLDRAFRISDGLPASSVVVNNTSNYWETHLPWGGGPGTKSGIGRLGGTFALDELSTSKTTILDLG